MNDILINFIQSLGINSGMAVVLSVLILIDIARLTVTIRMLIKHSAMNNRLNMHADYFDVVKNHTTDYGRFAMEAFKLAAEAKAGKPITDEDIDLIIKAREILAENPEV